MQKLKENSSDSEKNNSSSPDNLREELDEKFSLTQYDCHHTELMSRMLQRISSELVETCMKNSALQLRRISLLKVNVIKGTT